MQKNKTNIIILIPKFKYSGAGNSVLRLINFLDTNRFNISVICLNKCDYKNSFNKKVNIYELNNERLFFAFFKIFKILRSISIKSSKNIIISNHHYANVYAIFFKFILKNILVLSVERTCIYELSHYFSLKDYFKKIILIFLVKNFYKFSDHIISNTMYTKNEIRTFSKNNIHHIYPPSLKKIFNFKKKKILKSFNIVWVGRLDREKGVEEFLRLIWNIDFKTKVFILGGGKFKKKYENYVKENKNLNLEIYFKGYSKNTDYYFKKSHLLINTSHFEGSNNSIVEALNHNLLIMASNTPGGNKEIIKNTNGILFDLQNKKKFLKKIKFVRENYVRLQSKLKNKKDFLKNFIEKRSNNNYLKILNRM